MRKDVLVSLLAASMPVAAFANADVTSEIVKENWTSDKPDGFTADGLILTSPSGVAVSQTIDGLCEGQYKLKLTLGTLPENVASDEILVNGNAPESDGYYHLSVGKGDTSLKLEFKAKNGKAWNATIVSLELDFDFAAIRSELEKDIATVFNLINALPADDKEKEGLLMQASQVAAKIANVKDNDGIKWYKEYQLYNGAKGCVIANDIKAVSDNYNNSRGNYNAYTEAQAAFNGKWQTRLDQSKSRLDGATTYAQGKYRAAYAQIESEFTAYSTTQLKNAYDNDNAHVAYSKDELEKKYADFEKNLNDLDAAVAASDADHKAYEELTSRLTQAVTTYNQKLQAVLQEVKSAEGEEDVWGEERAAAQEELAGYRMTIKGFEDRIGDANTHDDAAELLAEITKNGQPDKLQQALDAIVACADNAVNNARTLKGYYAQAKADIAQFTADLNAIKQSRDAAVAKAGNYASKFNGINTSISSIENAISTFAVTVESANKAHTIASSYSETTTIRTNIDNLRNSFASVEAVFTAYFAVKDKISKELNPKIDTELPDYLKTIKADANANVKGYEASDKYPETLKGFSDTRTRISNSWETEMSNNQTESRQSNYENQINDAIAAIDAFKADTVEVAFGYYNTYRTTVDGYFAAYAELEKIIENPDVICTATGQTYGTELAAVKTRINTINAKYDEALAKKDNAHAAAMGTLTANLDNDENTGIAKRIAELKDSYATDAGNQLAAAVDAMRTKIKDQASAKSAEVAALISSLEQEREAVGPNYEDLMQRAEDLKAVYDGFVAAAEADSNVEGAAALALLSQLSDAIETEQETYSKLVEDINNSKVLVSANNAKAKEAQTYSQDITALVTRYRTTEYDPLKTAEIEVSATAFANRLSAIDTQSAALKEGYKLDSCWTKTEDGKDGPGTLYSKLKAEVQAAIDHANNTYKTNYDAYKRVNNAYVNAGLEGKIADLRTKAAGMTQASKDYYTSEIDRFEAERQRINEGYEADRMKFDGTMVSKETEYKTAITNLRADVEGWSKKVADNDEAYETLNNNVLDVQIYWNEVNEHITNTDESSIKDTHLNTLDAYKAELTQLQNKLYEDYKEGKFDDAAYREATRKAIEAVETNITILKQSQSEGYNAALAKDNAITHERFTKLAAEAQDAYKEAVDLLYKFAAISDPRLASYVTGILDAHTEIYNQSKVISDLKANEEKAYNDHVANNAGKLYDNSTYLNNAVNVISAIDNAKTEVTTKVNNEANVLFGNIKSGFVSDLADAKASCSGYNSAVLELDKNNPGSYAFGDVDKFIQDFGTDLLNAKEEYAVALDKILNDGTEAQFEAKLEVALDLAAWNEWGIISAAAGTAINNLQTEISKTDVNALPQSARNDYSNASNSIQTAISWLQNAKNLADGKDQAGIRGVINALKNYINTAITNCNNAAYYHQRYTTENADNQNAYALFNQWYPMVEASCSALDDYVDGLSVANMDVCDFSSIQENLKNIRGNVDSYFTLGTCDNHKTGWQSSLLNVLDRVYGSYGTTNTAEYNRLMDYIQEAQMEYNLAVSAVTGDQEKLQVVESKRETLDIIGNAIRSANDQLALDLGKANTVLGSMTEATDAAIVAKALKKEELYTTAYNTVKGKYLSAEAEIAQLRFELSAYYDNELSNKVAEGLKGNIAAVQAALDACVAGISDEKYAAVQDKFNGEFETLQGKLDAITSEVNGHLGNGSVIFYEDMLNESITTISSSCTELTERVSAYKDKYDTMLEGIDELNAILDNLETKLADARVEKDNYTHKDDAQIGTYYREEADMNEAYASSDLEYYRWAVNAWADAADPDAARPSVYESDILTYIKDMRINNAYHEYLTEVSILTEGTNQLLSKVNTALLDGYKYLYDKETLKTQDQVVKDKASKVKSLVSAFENYINNTAGGVTYEDIEGNRINGKYSETADGLFLEEVAKAVFKDQAAKLNEMLAEATALEEAGKYLPGDAAIDPETGKGDGKWRVNDYDKILGYVLMRAEDQPDRMGIEFAAANVVQDAAVPEEEVIDIADLTAVTRLITTGSYVQAFSGIRMAPAKVDDVLSYNIVNENNAHFLEIKLEGSHRFVAGQMDIQLPEGAVLLAAGLGDRAALHTLNTNDLGDGVHRIVISSIDLQNFAEGGDQVLVRLEIIGDVQGTLIQNAKFTDSNARRYTVAVQQGGATTGIGGVTLDSVKSKIYSVGGQMKRMIEKGVNIIRNSDGTVTKIFKK